MDSSGGARSGRVALFTPLPPSQTGTADYAADLIPELEKLVQLQVFERVPRNFKPEKFDAVLYQIGNNPFHAQIYDLALRHPGVVVLHEVNVHDLIRDMGKGGERGYFREVVYEIFGQELESLPEDGLIEPGPQARGFTMIRRLLDRSRACIVHSRFAEEQVRLRDFHGRIAHIPHGARVRDLDGRAYRERLGIRPEDPLIGIFGYQRPDKQACDCLLVFQTILDKLPAAKLLVAGLPHPEVPLDERVKELGLQDSVRQLGFQTLEDLDRYIAACDVVLNLRATTYGETSGIQTRAFGLGKTVVLSDNGANQELPDEICAKIPVDKLQNRVLVECLLWLLSDRKMTMEIGCAAQQWVATTSLWEAVARSYADFLFPSRQASVLADASDRRLDPRFLRDYVRGWSEPQTDGWRYLEAHTSRLIKTLQMTPRGANDQRILEMGCYLQITPALRELRGYGEIRGCYLGAGGCKTKVVQNQDGKTFECTIDLFDAEMDTFPYPSHHFHTVLCCELLEHLQCDPMQMMREIHRVLKPDGVLILTTPNVASLRVVHRILGGHHPAYYNRFPRPFRSGELAPDPGHFREYSPTEIAQLLSDSGFVVLRIETAPYSETPFAEAGRVKDLLEHGKQSTLLRDDCIFAVGRKAAIPKNRYPLWLYDE
jgi:glycosyltransferase involved in cell wall biosynthesis/SAM-dependent methyltransferase